VLPSFFVVIWNRRYVFNQKKYTLIIEKLKYKCYTEVMKEFIVKDDRKVQLELERGEFYDSTNSITAYDSKDLHQIGYLNFKLKGDTAYIWSFKVSDPDFLRTGVGTVMLNCFEDYASRSRASFVDGRFYPDGEGAEYSKDFYESHGYQIYRDGYEQYISKSLSREEIAERNKVVDYSLTPKEKTLEQ